MNQNGMVWKARQIRVRFSLENSFLGDAETNSTCGIVGRRKRMQCPSLEGGHIGIASLFRLPIRNGIGQFSWPDGPARLSKIHKRVQSTFRPDRLVSSFRTLTSNWLGC